MPRDVGVLMQSAAGATGNGTAMVTSNMSVAVFVVSGTFSGTITWEAEVKQDTWDDVAVQDLAAGTNATTTTTEGIFRLQVAALHRVRARISGWASGAITVNGYATEVGGGVSPGTVNIGTLPDELQGPSSPSIDSYTSAAVNLAASTADQELVATPGANKQIWVYGLYMMADTAAGTVALQDEDNTALSGVMAVSDEGGWVLSMSGNFAMPWIKVATNKALEADTGACTVDGIITYGVVSV